MNFEELKIESSKNNIVLTDEMIKKLDSYADLLKEWNEKINLTAIVEKEEVIEKHFFDSLLLLKYVQKCEKLADIGSGAGFPGMVIAIARPDINVTLIEPTGKRCTFLETIKKELSVNNVEIINQRAEEYISINREIYDVVTARAVANLQVLAELCIPFVKINGQFISMKGSQGEEEAKLAEHAFIELGASKPIVENCVLPDEAKRVFVIGNKIKETPKKYPRAYAKIKKKPL